MSGSATLPSVCLRDFTNRQTAWNLTKRLAASAYNVIVERLQPLDIQFCICWIETVQLLFGITSNGRGSERVDDLVKQVDLFVLWTMK